LGVLFPLERHKYILANLVTSGTNQPTGTGRGSIRGAKIELDEVEAETARKFMKAAIYQARLAHSSGQVTFTSNLFHWLAFYP